MRVPETSSFGNAMPANTGNNSNIGNGSNDRPRPLGQPNPRDAIVVQRPPPVAETAGPASAREACGRRVFIAMAVCMDEKCEEPRYRSTAECIAVLARKTERANR
jgi:hypothetical protein